MLEARDFTVIVEVVEENIITKSSKLPVMPEGSGLPPVLPSLAQVVASGVDGLEYSDLIYIHPQRGTGLHYQGKYLLVLDQDFVLAKIVGVDVDQDGNVIEPFELVNEEECPF